MTKRIEKLAKKERKKILKAAEHETSGPMAMQPQRDGDVIEFSPGPTVLAAPHANRGNGWAGLASLPSAGPHPI